jgi:hypothetical protein
MYKVIKAHKNSHYQYVDKLLAEGSVTKVGGWVVDQQRGLGCRHMPSVHSVKHQPSILGLLWQQQQFEVAAKI